MSAIAVSADATGKSSVIPKRNQTMELCKFIASFFVVFIHAPFPGKLGGLVDCLARFAVPMFFMISGYFNYQASSRQVLRRLKHILTLFLIGALFRQFCDCVTIELNGGSTIAHLLTLIPESDEILRLLILQIPPYTGHLWYLCAMMVCYLVFWLFVRFQEECHTSYKGFYVLGALCFLSSLPWISSRPHPELQNWESKCATDGSLVCRCLHPVCLSTNISSRFFAFSLLPSGNWQASWCWECC